MQEKSHPKQHKKPSALQLLNQNRMSIILQIRERYLQMYCMCKRLGKFI